MKSFSDQIANLVRPEKKSIYVLHKYTAGTASTLRFYAKTELQKTLSVMQSAKKKFLYEIIEEPDEAYTQLKAEYDQAYASVVTSFLRKLRAEYCDIPDKAYHILINEAYDRGHSAGYDEVASYMEGLAELYWQLVDTFQSDPDHDIKELVKEGQFIKAVKPYREKYGVGLREAKAACDEMKL